jgi:hypothetical protein
VLRDLLVGMVHPPVPLSVPRAKEESQTLQAFDQDGDEATSSGHVVGAEHRPRRQNQKPWVPRLVALVAPVGGIRTWG